jgi:muramoyltetrapeptide carboxypeptidase
MAAVHSSEGAQVGEATRRSFLGRAGALLAAPAAAPTGRPAVVKPPRLRPGDTVGLIDPASATFLRQDVAIVTDVLAAMGYRVKRGAHLMDRYGYLAGRDRDRAADVNALFADPEVGAILAVRGGWGSARLLPHLDWDVIRRHPKVLVGYSDLTALLNAVHARTGLVTFHGPVGVSTWTPFSAEHARRVLVDGEALTMSNPVEVKDTLVPVEDRVWTITPGVARGRLLGGNLTVLSALVGTPYLPDFEGAILFLEDVREQIYRIDRMLTQLALAGILGKVRGVVFGKCTRCEPGEGYGSLTLEEVFDDHLRPLGVPAWHGAMIGHIDQQFTLPLGVEAEIDAARGTIRLLAPAVV